MSEKQISLLRTYFQSFLRWLFCQNYMMAEKFTDEEICNYFFQTLRHPYWFKCYMKEFNFETMCFIYDYCSHYKDQADNFKELIPIHSKLVMDFSITRDVADKKMPTSRQVGYLNILNKGKFVSMSEIALMGEEEMSVTIDFLKRGVVIE